MDYTELITQITPEVMARTATFLESCIKDLDMFYERRKDTIREIDSLLENWQGARNES